MGGIVVFYSVIIIGIFALPEIIHNIGKINEKVTPAKIEKRIFFIPKLHEIKENFLL